MHGDLHFGTGCDHDDVTAVVCDAKSVGLTAPGVQRPSSGEAQTAETVTVCAPQQVSIPEGARPLLAPCGAQPGLHIIVRARACAACMSQRASQQGAQAAASTGCMHAR